MGLIYVFIFLVLGFPLVKLLVICCSLGRKLREDTFLMNLPLSTNVGLWQRLLATPNVRAELVRIGIWLIIAFVIWSTTFTILYFFAKSSPRGTQPTSLAPE